MEKKALITIVDDLKDNLTNYKELLEETFDLNLIQDPLTLINSQTLNDSQLVLLDLHMPTLNGFELYKKIKELKPLLPIIFLSGDPSEESTIYGLELGADDFIVKPVPLRELIARIKNKIQNKNKINDNSSDIINLEGLSLFVEMQTAEIDSKKVQLTPIEFKFIHLLAKNPNKVFNREFVTNYLWPNIQVQNQNVDTHLSNLRKKLSPFSEKIKTIKSRGYILRIG